MKELVLGAGTVGLLVAARLSAVCEVCAVAPRKRQVDTIRTKGFLIGACHQIETPVNACIADLIRFRGSLPNR